MFPIHSRTVSLTQRARQAPSVEYARFLPKWEMFAGANYDVCEFRLWRHGSGTHAVNMSHFPFLSANIPGLRDFFLVTCALQQGLL